MKRGRQKLERGKSRGTALIITLAFLTIITILILGFVVSMRTERLAAGSMADNEQAKQMAQSALVHAISLLRDNIPDPTDPTIVTPANGARNWFSNPGRLTVIDSLGSRTVALHTGSAAAADTEEAVNLNAASPTSGKYPITGANDPMWVAWVNVLKDESVAPGPDNKVVGRYAFWVDDESTKINVNVARGKPSSMETDLKLPSGWGASSSRDLMPYVGNSFTVGAKTYGITHPAAVNVDTLGLSPTVLETDITAKGFFKVPEDVRPYFASDAQYEAEKFNFTVFGRSPEFNVFGKSRIFFTRWASEIETGPGYQHSYHPEQPMTFYAYTMGVSTAEANNGTAVHAQFRQVQEPVISSLAQALQRKDWPGMGSAGFRWTASSSGDAESDQIAVNINSMVSHALRGSPGGQGSSANGGNVTDDLVRKWGIPGDFPGVPYGSEASNVWKGPVSGKGVLAIQPFPQLNEMGIRLTPLAGSTATTWRLQVDLMQEVYLPPGFFRNTGAGANIWHAPSGTGSYQANIFAPYVRVEVVPTVGTTRVNTTTDASASGSPAAWKGNPFSITGPSLDGYAVLTMGRVVSTNTQFTNTGGSPANLSRAANYTVNVRVRAGLGTNSSTYASQMAPFPIPQSQAPVGTVPSGLVALPESDGYLEFSFTINGSEVDGMIVDPSLRPQKTYELNDPRTYYRKSAWFPMGSPSFDSLGFPNFNSTVDESKLSKFAMWNLYGTGNAGSVGMLSFVPTGTQRGVAWDTLKFHSYNPAGDLPDWLVLDLVAPQHGAPISVRNSTAGKINLNSRIYPDDSPVFTPPARVKPLQALFLNMPKGPEAATAIAGWQSATQAFDYVGRITEVPGVADLNQGSTDFEKEVLLRNLAGMMTAQSNVFGVWGVAQTVRKSPRSTDYGVFEKGDFVSGEKRFYAVVERYVWPGKDGVPGNGEVGMSGTYTALAEGGPAPADQATSPATPPTQGLGVSSRVKTSDPTFTWPPIDGPQQPQLLPVHGTAAYAMTPVENSNNPLAALMKYRIIYFTYLD